MRKIVALAFVLSLVGLLSALPANAQVGPPWTVVDRNAVTLTYQPFGLGSGDSTFAGAVSYQLNPMWDLLVSFDSNSGFTPTSAWRAGGRYYLPRPSAEFTMYASAQYVSCATACSAGSTATSAVLLGGGLIQTLAPTLRGYTTLNYDTNAQNIVYDFGVQYQWSRQIGVVAGWNSNGVGYLGLSYRLGR